VRAAERLDDVGVEVTASAGSQVFDRGGCCVRVGAVRTGVRESVVHVGDRDDATGEGDCGACESVGVAAAVPAFVVSAYGGRDGI
jgi:hypothetical protein